MVYSNIVTGARPRLKAQHGATLRLCSAEFSATQCRILANVGMEVLDIVIMKRCGWQLQGPASVPRFLVGKSWSNTLDGHHGSSLKRRKHGSSSDVSDRGLRVEIRSINPGEQCTRECCDTGIAVTPPESSGKGSGMPLASTSRHVAVEKHSR